jgi:hypothetical protein
MIRKTGATHTTQFSSESYVPPSFGMNTKDLFFLSQYDGFSFLAVCIIRSHSPPLYPFAADERQDSIDSQRKSRKDIDRVIVVSSPLAYSLSPDTECLVFQSTIEFKASQMASPRGAWSAKFPVYQLDFTAIASGKRVASTKRRIRWCEIVTRSCSYLSAINYWMLTLSSFHSLLFPGDLVSQILRH